MNLAFLLVDGDLSGWTLAVHVNKSAIRGFAEREDDPALTL
jgi:hypothetical protein